METFSKVYLSSNIQTDILGSMSEENLDANLPTIDQRLQSLEKMFTTFMATSIKDRNKTSMAIERLNDHLNNNKIRSKVESPSDSMRSIVPEKRLDDRRTSMFFGRSPIHDSAAEQQNHI